MTLNKKIIKTEHSSIDSVASIFKKVFYMQPVLIQAIPSQKLFVTIKNERDVEIKRQNETDKSKEITFQREEIFQPFLLQTENKTCIVVQSLFSLYEHISREPYLEIKAEYQFQQQLRNALKLTGGYTYHLPGNSNDFVSEDVAFEDVSSQDLELRYEHDGLYYYLFILI